MSIGGAIGRSVAVGSRLQPSGGGNGTAAGPVEQFSQGFRETVGVAPERVVLAAVVVLVGWYGSRLLVRYFGRPLARRFRRPSVARTVLRSARGVVLLVTAVVALSVLGFRYGDLLISVGVFSAVVGIVLAPIVGSIINGLFVIADQPYEIGDLIELADRNQRGFVEDITLRYTKVFTLDNTFLVIPNGSIRNRDVINHSAEDERTRLTLDVIVTYEGDLDEARDLIERAARDVDAVISGGPGIRIGAARYPAGPTCYIDQFGDHGVHLRLRYWAKQPYKLLTVRSLVQTRVWDALDDADVEIAYPHQHLIFDETSGQANVRVESGPNGHRPDAEVDGHTATPAEPRADADGDNGAGRRPEPDPRPDHTRRPGQAEDEEDDDG
jgi:small-conductance mechanosensitive channel